MVHIIIHLRVIKIKNMGQLMLMMGSIGMILVMIMILLIHGNQKWLERG